MRFYWWDDAIAWAFQIARDTAIRHKVTREADGFWTVDLADDAALIEACS